jgi:N6-L-threonylcarbamoyladenine synthase
VVILGIESSCDETAAAVVSARREILSNVTYSQIKQHIPYGGVVPEIAARNHLLSIESVITAAMQQANLKLEQLDGIAVTSGPGLIGGVMVGVMAAKALAAALQKPLIAINHLEGHALTVRLTDPIPFPFLLLLISGGHAQFLLVEDLGKYHLLGQTKDDAVGEAFDKVAQLLELDYPGGPHVERLAQNGDPKAYAFPRPLKGKPGCDLSFSGLKTAVRQVVQELTPLTDNQKANIAASFQQAVAESLADRLEQAVRLAPPSVQNVVIAGGAAANQTLRDALQKICLRYNKNFVAPPLALCTDNAAMIAWAGVEYLQRGYQSPLNCAPRPRWPLMDLSKRISDE